MKYLQHKKRNGFAIINEDNKISTFEVHNQGCEISELSIIDIDEYYEADKDFILSQLKLAKQEINDRINCLLRLGICVVRLTANFKIKNNTSLAYNIYTVLCTVKI
jgi:hypothetical protein